MMPIPELTIDLGSKSLRLGWTMDGTGFVLMAIVLVPWIVLGLAALIDVFDAARHRTTSALAHTTARTTTAETPVCAGATLRRAA